jgi:hypothetical protein
MELLRKVLGGCCGGNRHNTVKQVLKWAMTYGRSLTIVRWLVFWGWGDRALLQALENAIDNWAQLGQILLDGVPDNFEVDTEVGVD